MVAQKRPTAEMAGSRRRNVFTDHRWRASIVGNSRPTVAKQAICSPRPAWHQRLCHNAGGGKVIRRHESVDRVEETMQLTGQAVPMTGHGEVVPTTGLGEAALLTRRGFIAAGLAAGLATGLVRPARAEVQVKWMTLAAHYYMAPIFAMETGLFAKQGAAVDVGIATAPPTLLPAVVSGTIQVGVSTAIQVSMARENGLDVVLLAGSSIQTRGIVNTAVLARPDATFAKPADFVGKRVVIPGMNGVFHVMFETYLMDGGVDPKSVTYVESGFAQAGDMLRNGAADAVLSTEPFLSRMVDAGTARKVVDYWTPTQDTIFDSFYICQGAWARDNQETVAKLRAALNQSIADMKADMPKMQAVEGKYLKLPPEVIARSGPPMSRVDIRPSEVQFWIDTASRVGLLQKKPTPAELIA
jgi:NitT/TauT family transport system substrate-binding protein